MECFHLCKQYGYDLCKGNLHLLNSLVRYAKHQVRYIPKSFDDCIQQSNHEKILSSAYLSNHQPGPPQNLVQSEHLRRATLQHHAVLEPVDVFKKTFLLDQGITWKKWPGGHENPLQLSNMKLKSGIYTLLYVCIYIYICICSIYFCWESPRFLWGKVSDTYVIPVSFNVIKRVHSWKLAVYPEKHGGFLQVRKTISASNLARIFFQVPNGLVFAMGWELLFKVGMDMGWIWFFNFTVEFHRISLCELDSFQNLGLFQSISMQHVVSQPVV